MIRFAPRSNAASMISPVPVVDAATASFFSLPPASNKPEAQAISMIAVPRCKRQSALTGSPSGPVTSVVRFAPPSASRVPSPPSASGRSIQS
ncbi:unannotated protein [freshwater metagenome]|uniref:Unannotated protein n=1 Tax=freshwater metagenome TaxID=449393 RepID=A0A6J6H931_9ZZZZ